MRVRIVSMFAMMNPNAEQVMWEGDVPVYGAGTMEHLEEIFRAFNRVEEFDAERLEAWGYRMPSLSVGDIVALDSGDRMLVYRVDSIGFVEVIPGLPV